MFNNLIFPSNALLQRLNSNWGVCVRVVVVMGEGVLYFVCAACTVYRHTKRKRGFITMCTE